MDKITLRNIIVHLRNEGNSFQTISNTLKEQYGIDRTRQACQSMYKRATSIENKDKDTVKAKLTIDIVHLFMIGLSDQQIKSTLDSWYAGKDDDYDVSLYKIRDIISKNLEYIGEIIQDKVETAANIINDVNSTYDDLVSAIGYNDIMPVKSVMNAIIEKAVTLLIKRDTIDILSKTISLTEDTTIIKKIAVKHDLDIRLSDINRSINSFDILDNE